MTDRKARGLLAICAAVLLLGALLWSLTTYVRTDRGLVGEGEVRSAEPSPPAAAPRPGRARRAPDDGSDPAAERTDRDAGPTRALGPDGACLGGLGADPRGGEPSDRHRHVVWITTIDRATAVAVAPNPLGQFHVRGLDPGATVVLRAVRTDDASFLLDAERSYRVEELAGATVTFLAPETRQVRVVCRDSRGTPVAARVRIDRTFGKERYTVAHVDTGVPGAADLVLRGTGTFVATLEASAMISSPTYHPREVDFEAGDGPTADVVFTVPAPAALRVVVRGVGGSPVAGSLVSLQFRDGGLMREHPAAGATDATGTLQFTGLLPGDHVVQVTAPHHVPEVREVTLVEGETKVVSVTVAAGGSELTGRITCDGAGFALDRAGVFLVRRGQRPADTLAFHTVERGDDGVFTARGLLPGDYELNLVGDSFASVLRFQVDRPLVDLGTVDVGGAHARGSDTALLRVIADAPPTMRVKVLFRCEAWEPRLWRSLLLDCADRPSRIEGLAPGRYRFEVSPAALDHETFDVSDTATLVIESPPAAPPPAVELRLVRRR